MHYLILAIFVLILVYAGLRAFINANPKDLARKIRNIGGVAALGLALFMTATGRFPLAIPLAILAVSLLGRNLTPGFNPFGGSARKSTGQASRVRTKTIEMELDHDSGDMDGRVLKGKFAQRQLSSLGMEELMSLMQECNRYDPQAGQLLEVYLDKRFPDWRGEDEDGARESRREGTGPDGPLSIEEAYEILGLKPGATKSDVKKAHRTLMKSMHPDQGGSTYLAAKINEAKDVLLAHL